MSFFRFYKYCLLKHPVKTKAITNGIIYSVADITCQKIESKYTKEKNKEFDKTRTFVFWLFGTFMSGPANHFWMNRLNKFGQHLIKSKNYTKNTANLTMVCMDQLLYSPIYSIVFFTSAHFLNDKFKNINKDNKTIFSESIDHTKNIFPITYTSEFFFWPIIQFVNFKYININYRVLFMSKCNLLWSVFTSYMVNN